MSRYYSYETIRDNAKDVTLENGVKHRCIDPDALLDIEPADVIENIKSEWKLTDYAYTVYCKRCRYKHNRASQYCPECGAYMTNGTKWFSAYMRGEA